MRLALIADIHGNSLALRSVLDDIARQGADQIICLGDVATLGPDPQGAISMIADLKCRSTLGNHDEFLLEPTLIHGYTEDRSVVEAVDWCRDLLVQSELELLRSFEFVIELTANGHRVSLFHGSPLSHTDDVLATTRPEELDRLFAGREAELFGCAHTHIQMLRQHRGSFVVNPGSVGLPFKEFVGGQIPTLLHHAEYALVECDRDAIGVALHRVPLDKRALRRAAEASRCPMREFLIEQYS